MLKRYSSTEEFYREISPYLRENEAMNNLALGLSGIFVTKPERCFYESALIENGKLRGALVGSVYGGKHNLVASPISDASAAEGLFRDFVLTGLRVDNLVAELEAAEVYKRLIEATGRRTVLHAKQGIYRCRKVKLPAADSSLVFRAAEKSDVPVLAKWIEEFAAEAVPFDPPPDGVARAEERIGDRGAFLLSKNDQAVSMACWGRDVGTSCSVNLVYTPKEFRKHGFASVVTARLTHRLLEEGRRETCLYTDLTNPTSNKIYQEIGYEFVGHGIVYGISS